jgi:hypothetical protein
MSVPICRPPIQLLLFTIIFLHQQLYWPFSIHSISSIHLQFLIHTQENNADSGQFPEHGRDVLRHAVSLLPETARWAVLTGLEPWRSEQQFAAQKELEERGSATATAFQVKEFLRENIQGGAPVSNSLRSGGPKLTPEAQLFAASGQGEGAESLRHVHFVRTPYPHRGRHQYRRKPSQRPSWRGSRRRRPCARRLRPLWRGRGRAWWI